MDSNSFRFGDADTVAATGAFLQGELERLDPKLYAPIADFTGLRDVRLRTDVSIADSVSSFILSTYAAASAPGSKKSWAKALGTAIGRTSVGATKVISPMTPWAQEVSWNMIELAQAARVGRPIDTQKLDALKMKHDMDLDLQIYFGDDELSVKGLLNSDQVTVQNATKLADSATQNDWLTLFNNVLNAAWKQSKYTRLPKDMLISPALFAKLNAMQLTNTDKSVLTYILENNLSATTYGPGSLSIRPCKYLTQEFGGFANERIVTYTNDEADVRFPLVPLQHTAPQYRGLDQTSVYYCAFGVLEIVRPDFMLYTDLAA